MSRKARHRRRRENELPPPSSARRPAGSSVQPGARPARPRILAATVLFPLLVTLSLAYTLDHLLWEKEARHDFRSLHVAARVMDQGGNPYDVGQMNDLARSSGIKEYVWPYLYTPFLASMLVPVTRVIDVLWLQHLWTFLSALALALSLSLAIPLVESWLDRAGLPEGAAGSRRMSLLLLACLMIRVLPTKNIVFLGQVDLVIVALLTLSLWCDREGHWRMSGIFLAVAVVTRVTPVVLALGLVWRGRWRTLAWLGGSAAALIALSILVGKVGPWVEFLRWVPSMAPGSAVPGLFPPHAYPNFSIAAWVSRLAGDDLWLAGVVVPAVTLVIILAIVELARDKEPELAEPLVASGLLIAVVLASPIAYLNHLVYILPGIMFLLAVELQQGRYGRFASLLAIVTITAVDFPLVYDALGLGPFGRRVVTSLNLYGLLTLLGWTIARLIATPAAPPGARSSAPIGWPVHRGLEVVAILAAVASLGTFGIAASLRLTAPFALDWAEGLSMLHALSLCRGWPPFHAPDVESIPPIYTPGHALLLWGLARVGLAGFFVPRLLAVGMTLAAVVVLYRLVRREGGGRTDALAGVAVFLGSYVALDRSLDTGRVDTPALFFFALALRWLLAPGRWPAGTWAGILSLVAAGLIKQSYGLPGVALILGMFARRPVKARHVLLRCVAIVVGVVVLLEIWCRGWFLFWTVKLPGMQAWDLTKRWMALAGDLGGAFPVVLLLAAPSCLVLRILAGRSSGPGGVALPLAALATYAMGALGRIKVGGHVNVWTGFVFMEGLMVGALLADLNRLARHRPSWGPFARACRATIVLVAVVGAMTRLGDPRSARPGADEYIKARMFQREVQSRSRVLCPIFPLETELAGGAPQFSLMPLWDISYAGADLSVRGLQERIRSRWFEAVMLPLENAQSLPGLAEAYEPIRVVPAPQMVGGNRMLPLWVWLPRKDRQGPDGPAGAERSPARRD
ncbi:MAG: DUF2029 domain-containing protein [Candidatus Riflebacteria bacterium]|nr:DUF2029 domain-containing protein [Candidatus Riflebacteria bacterium]